MKGTTAHLADEQLLMSIDGELPVHEEKALQKHLETCWRCRVRRAEFESAIGGFVHAYHQQFDRNVPPIAGPRALLKAQLSQLTPARLGLFPSFFGLRYRVEWALAIAGCVVAILWFLSVHQRRSLGQSFALVVSVPDSRSMPPLELSESRQSVCSQPNTRNRIVPVALQRKVFEEYRLVGAEPQAYEVDYLVTPALGGADDIHNLWPQSYGSTVWNARVKDALEDHLRKMVCDGSLDLATAQREIASNWIAAYKKYFHTDRPLE
jgi:hypothetical protein